MATTVMNIRMDSELKKQFEAFCADMGLSVTAAVTVCTMAASRSEGTGQARPSFTLR